MAYNNSNNGIVRFDSSDSTQPLWNFQTAQGGTMQGPDILKGSMNFVRKGQAGILVAFGGYNTTHKGTEFAAGWDWDQQSLSNVFVYDIFSNVWYLVEATGDLPPLRAEFCSSVSSAPDDSSFQITIHGGWDQFYGRAYGDVYVLTLPAFEWIKIDAPSDLRNRHACNMFLDGTQMIVSGGGGGGSYCNQSYPPIKVLDTSTYTWQTHFQPDGLEYSVPSVVTAIVGGDSKGGATINQPKAGWKNPDLGTIFSQTLPRDTYVYPSSSKNNSAPNPAPKPQGSSVSTGAIAGGVVGGAIALALICVAIWLCTRKRKQRRNGQGGSANNWTKPELGGHEIGRGSRAFPGELEPNRPPAQLETKTDRAELDAYQYAVAMQGVQSPVEMEAGFHGQELSHMAK